MINWKIMFVAATISAILTYEAGVSNYFGAFFMWLFLSFFAYYGIVDGQKIVEKIRYKREKQNDQN